MNFNERGTQDEQIKAATHAYIMEFMRDRYAVHLQFGDNELVPLWPKDTTSKEELLPGQVRQGALAFDVPAYHFHIKTYLPGDSQIYTTLKEINPDLKIHRFQAGFRNASYEK